MASIYEKALKRKDLSGAMQSEDKEKGKSKHDKDQKNGDKKDKKKDAEEKSLGVDVGQL